MNKYAGRSVLITGAPSGIGRACASYLSKAGFFVFAGVRKQKDADVLRNRERVVPVLIDVADKASIDSAAAEVSKRLNNCGLDALVNNAGIGLTAPVEYITAEMLQHEFVVNVFGQIAVTQAFLPLIRKARGRIINMGSAGSHLAIPFFGAICGSKSAFLSLNDAL